jgi:hypothetical protein
MLARGANLALAVLLACNSAAAFEPIPPKKTLFAFVGQFNKGTFPGWSMIPYAAEMESNFLIGGAIDAQMFKLGPAVTLGAELGAAGRFGDRSGAEIFGGASIRHVGIPVGNVVTITPAVVIGLSAVTQSVGIEREREMLHSGNAALLYYLGPEIALRFHSMPNVEIVFRTHHRSGLKGGLGNMREGSNVNVLGVRIPF